MSPSSQKPETLSVVPHVGLQMPKVEVFKQLDEIPAHLVSNSTSRVELKRKRRNSRCYNQPSLGSIFIE